MEATLRKRKGAHYTPPELAEFLARQTVACLSKSSTKISILDPACGEGQLLVSLVTCLQDSGFQSIQVVGFDTDANALQQAESSLAKFELSDLQLINRDFLTSDYSTSQFDCVIANPPYVRTQVLGGARAQRLAAKFNLKGRVDLYQAFAVAIAQALKPGGAMGLLTSNRFLTVKSGAVMRQILRENFELKQIFDLGDTRLFEAAVLPAILTGIKRNPADVTTKPTKYHRVYRIDNDVEPGISSACILAALGDPSVRGEIDSSSGRVAIERGVLVAANDHSVWALGNPATRRWLKQLRSNQSRQFGDIAEIKVGIKTTADSVFIRESWDETKSKRPETKLLRPLITHHDAQRWSIGPPSKTVLYPYEIGKTKRTPIELNQFPQARSYFEQHRQRLEGRAYVIDAGRKWYEIWVPHQPADWAQPKIVWPDISEQPKFFFDTGGAIVNGDCYWIKLRPNVDPDWLYMMLAVANSTIATQYYDTVFHNKLYAGRRRFMTQYVKDFPLPELDSRIGKQIVKLTKQLIASSDLKRESKLEEKVQKAFGF